MATPAKQPKVEATIPDFSQPFAQSNVTFVFDDGKRLYFNRGTLAFFSPVFDRMLLGDWKEGHSDEEVPLPLKSFDDFHAILRMIAQYDEALITDANVATLLSLADEYEMRNILIYCSSYILKHWQISPKRFEALEMALQFDLRKATEVLLPPIVCGSLADLKVAAEFLSPKVYAIVLHLRIVRQNELSKLGGILKCYPICLHPVMNKPFVCDWCNREHKECATGQCAFFARGKERPSTCHWCRSRDRFGKFCDTCRRSRCIFAGEICVCGVNCDDWLADDVVKTLLKKN